MSHIHSIVDVDSKFSIDPNNRLITTEAENLILVQGDHKSERYTFQIPRYVEGHDTTLCDRVEIHFTNITRNKRQIYEDVYIVDDLGEVADSDMVTFSWLVSKNATQFEGSLKFSITFLCFDDNAQVEYEWGTSEFDKIQILKKQRNTTSVMESNPDMFEEMRQDIADLKENGPTPGPGTGVISQTAKIGEVELLSSNWVGEGNLYSQVVNIDGVTENSQVDLTPSVEQLVAFYEKDLSFVTENEDGVVTVYAIGQKPMNDYVIQVTITEVMTNG